MENKNVERKFIENYNKNLISENAGELFSHKVYKEFSILYFTKFKWSRKSIVELYNYKKENSDNYTTTLQTFFSTVYAKYKTYYKIKDNRLAKYFAGKYKNLLQSNEIKAEYKLLHGVDIEKINYEFLINFMANNNITVSLLEEYLAIYTNLYNLYSNNKISIKSNHIKGILSKINQESLKIDADNKKPEVAEPSKEEVETTRYNNLIKIIDLSEKLGQEYFNENIYPIYKSNKLLGISVLKNKNSEYYTKLMNFIKNTPEALEKHNRIMKVCKNIIEKYNDSYMFIDNNLINTFGPLEIFECLEGFTFYQIYKNMIKVEGHTPIRLIMDNYMNGIKYSSAEWRSCVKIYENGRYVIKAMDYANEISEFFNKYNEYINVDNVYRYLDRIYMKNKITEQAAEQKLDYARVREKNIGENINND